MTSTSTLSAALEKFRSRRNEETDQEGWVVAYADLITLLFIFFSLMLSISVISRAKFELMTNQFNTSSTATSLVELKKRLDEEIKKRNLQAQVKTELGEEGLLVQFNEGILFPTAEASLNEGGERVLGQFSTVLKGMEKRFQLAVEGHTDSRPIHTAEFPSNWSLSSARAVNVVHYLRAHGIEEKSMMVRAFADTRPVQQPKGVDTGAKTDALAANRRVTLLVH